MSDYCKYHPRQKAAWFCQSCDTPFCSACVPEDKVNYVPKCTLCRRDLRSLSVSERIPPFWQKLSSLLAMPFSRGLLVFILLFAVILALLPAGKIGAGLTLLALIPIIEVIFECMERVASGDKLDDNATAYLQFKIQNQSIKLLLGYLLIGLVIVKIYSVKSTVGGLMAFFFILGIPASMIILMMEKSVLAMFNPLKIGFIIKQFNGAYFLLYGLMIVVSILAIKFNGFAQIQSPTMLAKILVYVVILYLMISVSILAGYLVYQYHYELNFTINRQSLYEVDSQVEKDDLVEANIFIQEGRYEDAQRILLDRINLNAADYRASEKLILLYAVQGNETMVNHIAHQYFAQMVSLQKTKHAADFYNKLVERGVQYTPSSMEVMIAIVSEMRNKLHFKVALELIDNYLVNNKTVKNWEQLYMLQAQLLVEFANRNQDAVIVLNQIINRSIDQIVMQKAEDYLQLIK